MTYEPHLFVFPDHCGVHLWSLEKCAAIDQQMCSPVRFLLSHWDAAAGDLQLSLGAMVAHFQDGNSKASHQNGELTNCMHTLLLE
jgi:hypothetical protein